MAPLDWGLGHATRCVPLINKLLAEGHELLLCGSGNSGKFLQSEFPSLKFLDSPSYRIKYSSHLPMSLMMMLQIPRILKGIREEKSWLEDCIDKHRITKVISDNRYGLHSKKIHSVLITHQLMIKCPVWLKFAEGLLHKMVLGYAENFDECWIPDREGENNLSGELSHKYKLPSNAKFIGPLSRFEDTSVSKDEGNKYDALIVLSGPEEQRKSMEDIVMSGAKLSGKKILLVRGLPAKKNFRMNYGNLSTVSHLPQEELKNAMASSDLIICRSGYSSIMDLEALGKTALLIPTPGQTEQEYLAKYLSEKKQFRMMSQEEFGKKFPFVD